MGGSSSKKTDGPQPVHDVLLEEWPSGFIFEGNVIRLVDKNRKIAALVEPDSIILGVNGENVDSDTFASTYDKANENGEKVTLTLQRPQGSKGPAFASESSHPESEVSKSLLIDILLCYFGVFIDIFGVTVTGPVMPFLQPVMGITDVQLGLIISVYNIASIPGALMTGHLMRTSGTRKASLFSLMGSAVTMAAQGLLLHLLMQSSDPKDPIWYWVFIGIRIVAGLTGSSMPVCITFVGMKVPAREKPKYMALTAVALTLAVMSGPLVGGTTAGFTPVFALPFYIGGTLALFGFLVSFQKLGDARPPKQASKGDSMPEAVKGLVAIAPFKMMAYASYIMLGPAYYIWRFNMLPAEIGAVTSLHGIYSAGMAIFVVPRLMANLGPEKTYLFGAGVMALGMAIVGFMPTWWSFQMVWSSFCGLGFACCNTGVNVVADRFATQSTRATMNSMLFIMDQVGMFSAGLIYGRMLAAAREADAGYILWLTASGVATIYFFAIFSVWRGLLIPAQRYKADNMDKKNKAEKISAAAYVFQPDPEPTDEDYNKYGKFLVDLLYSRKYAYRTRRGFIERTLTSFFTELPTDNLEHRMDVVWEKEEIVRQFKDRQRDIDDFYSDLSGMMTEPAPDVQRAPSRISKEAPDAKRR